MTLPSSVADNIVWTAYADLVLPMFLLALAIVIYAVILGWAMDRVLRFLEVKPRRTDGYMGADIRDERAVKAIARWER